MPDNVNDIIEGSSASLGPEGLVVTRVLFRDGVGGSAEQRLINALSASGIVRYQQYPGQAGLYCDTVNCVPAPNSNTKFIITATYKTMTADEQTPSATSPAKLTISTSLQEIETTRDKDDNQIILTYHAANDTTNVDKTGIVKTSLAILVLNFHRKEPTPPPMLGYINRVNAFAIFGYPARTLYLAHVNATITEDDLGVDVDYEFHFKESTWDVLVLANDPATGNPYDNIDPLSGDNNGYAIVQVFKTADFSGLNLT